MIDMCSNDTGYTIIKKRMGKFMKNVMAKYLNNEKGLVSIEWVGISAVVILAAVLISSGVMSGSSRLAGQVITNIDTSCTSIGGTAATCNPPAAG